MTRTWLLEPTTNYEGSDDVTVPDVILRHVEVGAWGMPGEPPKGDSTIQATLRFGWSAGLPCEEPGVRFALLTMRCLPQSPQGWGRGTAFASLRAPGVYFRDESDARRFAADAAEQLRWVCWRPLKSALMATASLASVQLKFPEVLRDLPIEVVFYDDKAFPGQVPPEAL